MKVVQKETFNVVGISVRTTNENGQAAKDIPNLWQQFMNTDMYGLVKNRIDDTICAVYTNYESDHTKPYDTVLGFIVPDLNTIPNGMVGLTIPKSDYNEFKATGDLTNDVVINKWVEIWNMDLNRTYKADFELYGEKAKNPKNGEVAIYISVN
ncbi:GyrI-like domain-containing protein [Tenacibaculum sp. 190524A02b]|uniref:Predicted transcriptional regulator YdeE, contains AraC-type DNA-binding domain n=1 Tax=Tenacibaculum vairaonense TaxID=3137860 RepID=A0ABM9PNN8_9FLAO